jgi:upstream activation factor subunit UAF30
MPSKNAKTQKPAAAAATPRAAKKTEAPAAAAPVQVAAAEPQNEVATEVTALQRLEAEYNGLLAEFTRLSSEHTSLRNRFRTYHASVTRELKAAQKQSKKGRKQAKGDRPPSGFVKPTRISNELAAFLKVKPGTEMARTDVTKAINAYVTDNGLKNKTNGRIIEPDSALSKLLKLNKGEELTYFNLQKYMTPHFAKQNKQSTTSA